MDDGVAELDRLMGRQDTLPATLEMTRDSVIELLTKISPMPRTLKLSVGPVSIEVDWADSALPAHGQPVPATGVSEPAAVRTPVVAVDSEIDHVHAPIVGVFHAAPEPGARPFVSVGDLVVPGQQIGIVEAMKLRIPVEADRHCRIAELLQPNGTPVEYGDPLFVVLPVEGG